MTLETVLDILEAEFKDRKTELDYSNPFQLLVAVILSAQTTDVAVNKVTPALFAAYPSPFDLADADLGTVESMLRTIGLYRNKARFIIACSQKLVEDFNGEVPENRADLMRLPGVGRKTANVVLAEAFDLPAIAVDTHVARVAKRLGIADASDDVLVIEQKLMDAIEPSRWARAHLLLLLFGRYYTKAQNKRDVYELLEELKEKHGL